MFPGHIVLYQSSNKVKLAENFALNFTSLSTTYNIDSIDNIGTVGAHPQQVLLECSLFLFEDNLPPPKNPKINRVREKKRE